VGHALDNGVGPPAVLGLEPLHPRGVAHGVANLGPQAQAILYAVNRLFTPSAAETDEWRLPWDRFGADFWAMERG